MKRQIICIALSASSLSLLSLPSQAMDIENANVPAQPIVKYWAPLTRNQIQLTIASAVYLSAVLPVALLREKTGKGYEIATNALCGATPAVINQALGQLQLAGAASSKPKRDFGRADLGLIYLRTFVFTGFSYGCYAGLNEVWKNEEENQSQVRNRSRKLLQEIDDEVKGGNERWLDRNSAAFNSNLEQLSQAIKKYEFAIDLVQHYGSELDRCNDHPSCRRRYLAKYQSAHRDAAISKATVELEYAQVGRTLRSRAERLNVSDWLPAPKSLKDVNLTMWFPNM